MYACPSCKSQLRTTAEGCGQCGFPIVSSADGALTVTGDFFPDHNHEAVRAAFENGQADFYELDERINCQFTNNFTIPLLKRLYGENKDIKILSVGSGIGADVKLLREAGYQAWGTDCGSRCLFWPMTSIPEFLVQCTDQNMPFNDGSFDFVMCHQVLEHVGVVGDSMILQDDYYGRRKMFIDNMMRLVKGGGCLNIATPNRLFPIDPGHSPNFFGVRIHGPFDYFLTSFGDMKSYCQQGTVIPLSPKNYYAGTFTARAGVLGRLFKAYLNALDTLPVLQGSFLNPLTNVLVRKHT